MTSKQIELDSLAAYIDSLADGYVKDILTDIRPDIVRAVRNDLCVTFSDLRQLETDYRAAEKNLLETRKQLAAAAAELDRTRAAIGRDVTYAAGLLEKLATAGGELAAAAGRDFRAVKSLMAATK